MCDFNVPKRGRYPLAEKNYFRLGYRVGSRALLLGREVCGAQRPEFIVLSGGGGGGDIKISKLKNISF